MSVDHLLQPLTEGGPGGVPLLHEAEYDAIAAARHEDDPSLPRGVWTSELKRADWPLVVRLCEDALTTRSKDLQVAAWLGEAWIALDGLAGGVRATGLLQGLCERFWDTLHPLPRDGDIEFRTAPLDWADEHWSVTLALRVPLVIGQGPEAITATLAQWREAAAADNENLKKKKPAAETAALTPQRILAQLAGMPAADIVARLETLRAWRSAIDALRGTVERIDTGAAAHWPKLRATLDQAEGLLRHGEPALPPAVLPVAALQQAAATSAPATQAPGTTNQEIPAGRDEAYYRLGLIADYLARAEPHSPVPTLIRRAIAWGNMPFADLLNELTHNNNEMQTLLMRKPL